MTLHLFVSCQSRAELNHAAIANRATQMVERLSQENNTLRKELQGYYGKLSKLQKVDFALFKAVSIRSNASLINSIQGSHSDWKTWKNGKAFFSQGKVWEF